MKKLAFKFALIDTAQVVFIIVALISLAVSFSSCSASWYSRQHDGCQQSQGYIGYGNRK